MFHTYTLLIGACLPLVAASVYPTQPVQATVWEADQSMRVSWIEDWQYPTLSVMGPFDISLWSDTDTYVAQLASGVDPTAKTCQVVVPGRALKGFKYNLRFTTSRPVDVVVYSADFEIVPANTTAVSTPDADANTGSSPVALATPNGTITGTGTSAGTESGFKTVPTTAGSSSTTIMTTATTSTSGRFGSTTPSGTPPPSGMIPGGGTPAGQRAASAGRRGVDVEKLKFRFVFVIWPVLMGITMAL